MELTRRSFLKMMMAAPAAVVVSSLPAKVIAAVTAEPAPLILSPTRIGRITLDFGDLVLGSTRAYVAPVYEPDRLIGGSFTSSVPFTPKDVEFSIPLQIKDLSGVYAWLSNWKDLLMDLSIVQQKDYRRDVTVLWDDEPMCVIHKTFPTSYEYSTQLDDTSILNLSLAYTGSIECKSS